MSARATAGDGDEGLDDGAGFQKVTMRRELSSYRSYMGYMGYKVE
jgi:hypothetical protein